MRNILIIFFDFWESNLSLQPWKYIERMVYSFISRGDKVTIISNKPPEDNYYQPKDENIKIIYINKLSPFHIKNLRDLIINSNFDKVFWWGSRKSFLYYPIIRKISVPVVLLFTGPIYYIREVLGVLNYLKISDYRKILFELLIPLFFLRKFINSKYVQTTIVLSKRNKERLLAAGVLENKILIIPIGKDEKISQISKTLSRGKKNVLLYMTAATRIRGIYFLLDSLQILNKRGYDFELLVLARGADNSDVAKINNYAKKNALNNKIKVIGGWLDKNILLKHMSECKILIMPFLLVHSEMPISIIEAFAKGLPVIAPNLDGIPEMIEERGIVYKHNKKSSLAKAIILLLENKEKYFKYVNNCINYISNYPSWDKQMAKLNNILK